MSKNFRVVVTSIEGPTETYDFSSRASAQGMFRDALSMTKPPYSVYAARLEERTMDGWQVRSRTRPTKALMNARSALWAGQTKAPARPALQVRDSNTEAALMATRLGRMEVR